MQGALEGFDVYLDPSSSAFGPSASTPSFISPNEEKKEQTMDSMAGMEVKTQEEDARDWFSFDGGKETYGAVKQCMRKVKELRLAFEGPFKVGKRDWFKVLLVERRLTWYEIP